MVRPRTPPLGGMAVLLTGTFVAVAAGCFSERRETVEREMESEVHVMPRTPQLRTYPCVEQCHVEREPDPTKRQLEEFHTLRSIRHGESMFWCPFCHDSKNLDQLRLLDDTPVPFDSAYRLCGQCHGSKLDDWEMGIHGLQSGYFIGTVERRSCPVCHDPHDPHRPSFQALPPPDSRRQETHDEE